MKNSQHLKAYVQMHPHNKMAWYLLGKEYYKNGQEGKANYCFNQAGEVYEAFEHSKVPSEMLREYEEGLIQTGRQRDQKRMKVRRLLLGLMLLLLLLFEPSVMAPGSLFNEKGNDIPESTIADQGAKTPEQVSTIEASSEEEGFVFTAGEGGKGTSSGQALMNLLQNRETPSFLAVLRLERSGKWLLWQERLPLDYTLVKTGNGRTVYQSYDSATCVCQPPEHSELIAQAAKWQNQQEETAVLWSSIRNFSNSKDRTPDSLKELVGPFPDNWLAGTTPMMEQEFLRLKNVAATVNNQTLSVDPVQSPPSKEGSTATNSHTQQAQDYATQSELALPFLTEPLTIVVDKQKHRLAVSSGSVILRNYKVGLGGDKTPEGSFVISDKVVNPNGHANGEFGSRGLQLSDSNYAIHGTNEPESIGKDESLGCIRMNRMDVEELFALVPMGTKVVISKGVLPEELLLPEKRFTSTTTQNQSNPRKVYHWLN